MALTAAINACINALPPEHASLTGTPAHARGRSGGAATDLLGGSPTKLALARAPDVALALEEEPGGKPAGKAGSMADDSSQPDSDATSAVGWVQRRLQQCKS